MAEERDAQEKTEQPTPKKRQDAKKKGQVPRSRELSTMMVTIAGAAVLFVFGGDIAENMATALKAGLAAPALTVSDPLALPGQFYGFFVHALALTWPVMAIALLATLASPSVMGGWTLNLSFKPERMDPVKGLQKVFSLRSLVELGKALAKLVFIGAVAVGLLWLMADDILGLGRQSGETAIANAAQLLAWFFLIVSLPLIIIAAIDVPWQLWSHTKELRMSRQEVKDEQKDTDGRPEVKSRLREMQQAAAQRRMMEEVPKADVVITNPTHYAVALRYDEARMAAPRVVAKGVDYMAARIRELAADHDVPMVESPPLTRAVYATTEIGQEIPGGLYLAIAQILAYVYQLREWQALGGEFPEPPEPEVDETYWSSDNAREDG